MASIGTAKFLDDGEVVDSGSIAESGSFGPLEGPGDKVVLEYDEIGDSFAGTVSSEGSPVAGMVMSLWEDTDEDGEYEDDSLLDQVTTGVNGTFTLTAAAMPSHPIAIIGAKDNLPSINGQSRHI